MSMSWQSASRHRTVLQSRSLAHSRPPFPTAARPLLSHAKKGKGAHTHTHTHIVVLVSDGQSRAVCRLADHRLLPRPRHCEDRDRTPAVIGQWCDLTRVLRGSTLRSVPYHPSLPPSPACLYPLGRPPRQINRISLSLSPLLSPEHATSPARSQFHSINSLSLPPSPSPSPSPHSPPR